MKKESTFLSLVSISFVLIISSCKKNPPAMATVQVRDAINNLSVNGAVVGIHRCGMYDPLCGIIPFRSSTSGNDGNSSFTLEDFNQAQTITVNKVGYWFTFEPKSNFINFYPDGWLRLRVIRGASYPPDATLRLMTNYVPGNKSNGLQVPPPADSIILLRAYGGAANRIDWSVALSNNTIVNSGTFSQNVPRQDTVNVTINF